MPKLILEAFLPYRLNRAAAAVSRELRAVYADKFALTIPEWRVLATLGQYETGTATAIGRHSAMHKTKVSRAVQALEARRWISRKANPTDRREAALALTAAGRKAYAAIIPDMTGFERAMAQRLGADGLRLVEQALSLLEDMKPAGRATNPEKARNAAVRRTG